MATELLDLKNRVALITGAGQGVGKATALLMAQHNAAVAINDFHLGRAEEVATQIRAAGGKALAVQCDVSDFAAVHDMSARVAKDLGPISVLVNNAGNAGPDGFPSQFPVFWESNPEEWSGWLKTNLFGVMNCCHAVLPGMIKQNYGRLLTVVSDAGRVGEPHMVVYSGAKAGAAGFMRGLARAVGRHLITANCISLSTVMTPALGKRLLDDPERKKKMLSNYVIRRLGEPEDAAAALLFLASDAASWITGQTYPVNGGYAFSN